MISWFLLKTLIFFDLRLNFDEFFLERKEILICPSLAFDLSKPSMTAVVIVPVPIKPSFIKLVLN